MPLATEQPRTAIITGGGSGIGRAVSQALCADGWMVVIAGRRPEPLAETRRMAKDSGLIETHVADITQALSVEELFDAVMERHRRVDLLFNTEWTEWTE